MASNSKKIKILALGIMCASVAVLIIGLIVYLIAVNTVIDPQSANYSQLLASKAFMQLIGVVVMASSIPLLLISVGYCVYTFIKKLKID